MKKSDKKKTIESKSKDQRCAFFFFPVGGGGILNGFL